MGAVQQDQSGAIPEGSGGGGLEGSEMSAYKKPPKV